MDEVHRTGVGGNSGVFDWQALKRQLTFAPRPFGAEADDTGSPAGTNPDTLAPIQTSITELTDEERKALQENDQLLDAIDSRIMNIRINTSFYDSRGQLKPDSPTSIIDRKL
jgi:hypothetical protein